MESCEMSFIKYILFIFNLIFAISGLGIIIAGAVVLADIGDFNHFMDKELIAPAIILIVAGAIVFLIAFLGCFGAFKESYNLLIAFSVCLLIIFLIEIAVGIVAAIYKNDFGQVLKTTLRKSMDNYSQQDMEKISWDKAQRQLMCCGVEGPNDWHQSKTQNLPFSCCHSTESYSQDSLNLYCINAGHGKYLYQTGCYNRLKEKIDNNSKVLIGVGIGIAFIEVIGIVLACWLAHTIKKGAPDDK